MRDLDGGPIGESHLDFMGETIPAEAAANSVGNSRKSRKKERKSRNDVKPKKSRQYFGSASNSISNRIQLSMLSSGLIHISKLLFSLFKIRFGIKVMNKYILSFCSRIILKYK